MNTTDIAETILVNGTPYPKLSDPPVFQVEFTQYVLPNGRKQQIYMQTSEEVYNRALELVVNAYRFEIEILRTGEISATIHDTITGYDVAMEIMENSPEVPVRVGNMILAFQPESRSKRQKEANSDE